MNKKFIIFILACLLFMVAPQQSSAAAEYPDVNIAVNGVSLAGSEPLYVEKGNTLVYYRFFFESLGMTVDMNVELGRVYVFDSGEEDAKPLITLWLGSKKVMYKDKEVTLPAPVRRIGNLTYMPVRSISEMLGYQVKFNVDEQTILLTKTITDEGDKIRPLFDSFFKEGQINPSREIFTGQGWDIYTTIDSEMGVDFNFLPLKDSTVSVDKIGYLSDNKAVVRVAYKSASAAFKREIDFIFTVTKEKEDWKLARLYLEGPKYEVAEEATAGGTVNAGQGGEAAAVMSGLDAYNQAWANGDAAAIIQSTSPAYISEFESETGLQFEDEMAQQAYGSEKQKVAGTYIPYLSADHAVVYAAELHKEWDDNDNLVEVPVDVMFRMDKTADGRWTVHSLLELVDSEITITLQ
jgi:hypothetical protein